MSPSTEHVDLDHIPGVATLLKSEVATRWTYADVAISESNYNRLSPSFMNISATAKEFHLTVNQDSPIFMASLPPFFRAEATTPYSLRLRGIIRFWTMDLPWDKLTCLDVMFGSLENTAGWAAMLETCKELRNLAVDLRGRIESPRQPIILQHLEALCLRASPSWSDSSAFLSSLVCPQLEHLYLMGVRPSQSSLLSFMRRTAKHVTKLEVIEVGFQNFTKQGVIELLELTPGLTHLIIGQFHTASITNYMLDQVLPTLARNDSGVQAESLLPNLQIVALRGFCDERKFDPEHLVPVLRRLCTSSSDGVGNLPNLKRVDIRALQPPNIRQKICRLWVKQRLPLPTSESTVGSSL